MASSPAGIRVLRTVRELREWRAGAGDGVPGERRPRRGPPGAQTEARSVEVEHPGRASGSPASEVGKGDEVEHPGPSEGSPRARVGIGLVPTMGALHDGHLSLVERAVAHGTTVASIFVNPTQFGPTEDYRAYPRNEAADLALLERAGCAAVFVPAVDEMYGAGDDTRVVPGEIAARLEGAARPGHFTGVCTVVAKLFQMVRPARAYFGQKDFQQLRVIQTMVRHLAMDVRVIACPTIRAEDGVALSSRNAYLRHDERRAATALSRGLFDARDAWERGERDPAALRAIVERAADVAGRLEYISVADPITLREIEGRGASRALGSTPERAVISLACRVGRARLIDNVLLGMTLDELSAA